MYKIRLYMIVSGLIVGLIFANNSYCLDNTNSSVNVNINHPTTKEMNVVLKDLEEFSSDWANSLTIICLKEDGEIYFFEPEDRTKFNYQDRYKIKIEDLADKLKEINKKRKVGFIQSVVLSFDGNIKYRYIFKVTEAYMNAVMEVTNRYKRIYFQFAEIVPSDL